MTVGEYIRTDDGLIGKVVSEPYEYKDSIGCDIDFGNNDIYNEYEMHQSIIKSSPNIIDLIEVGDYVNGKQVEWVGYDLYKEHDNGELEGIGEKRVLFNSFTKDSVRKSGIKSIVTKEQFEEMKYRIGE